MYQRFMVVCIVALLLVSLPATLGAQADPPSANDFQLIAAGGGTPGPITGPAARAIATGALSHDDAALARQKEQAEADQPSMETEPLGSVPSAVSPRPVNQLAKNGLANPGNVPSDSTGAIGTTRYIETVNSTVAIYNRANLAQLSTNTLDSWWDMPGSNSFDPQIMWDDKSNRFYYAGDSIFNDFDNRLAFGFSKSATPNDLTSASWCQYSVEYDSEFPDYPKLGDSAYFILIGVNTFGPSTFLGSDLVAISKPGAATITTCPDPASFKFGINLNLKVGTDVAFTPVAATGVDSSVNGWAVTRSASLPATTIGLFKVTRDSTTGLPVFAAGVSVNVPSYTVPAAAPQKGTTIKLDTLDARMTQAVAAVDPVRANKFAIWTQHTVKGGAGSMVRWYEIDPLTKNVLQTGVVKNSQFWFFNGAISPDRKVKTGTPSEYGSTMLLNFNSSSPTAYSAIQMVSKRGVDTMSSIVRVRQSTGPNIDFACQPVCRWGDYASATPDPNAPTGQATGVVWSTNMWNVAGTAPPTGPAVWRTWNWKSQP